MTNVVNVFLPMRAGSERVLKKNTRTFAGVQGGLCKIKLGQLLSCSLINRIVVSTDDQEVVDIASGFNSEKITIVKRPVNLASSETSTDSLIKYVPKIMPDAHILWTHVTSPFIDRDIYDALIKQYLSNLCEFDSLMTVTKFQKFIWNNDHPINYDRKREKWPRTQTLQTLWEVNSGAFLASAAIYKKHADRIGKQPYLYELREENSFDVDWPADFQMAEVMYSASRPSRLHMSNTLSCTDMISDRPQTQAKHII